MSSTTTHAKTQPDPLPETFDALNAMHALRPIKDEIDYDNAVELIDRLAVRGDLNEDQGDYLITLSELIARYDSEHYAIDAADVSGLDALKSILDDHEINASQLGEMLGNRALGSKILRGERELSKTHLRILGDRFKVNPSLFM